MALHPTHQREHGGGKHTTRHAWEYLLAGRPRQRKEVSLEAREYHRCVPSHAQRNLPDQYACGEPAAMVLRQASGGTYMRQFRRYQQSLAAPGQSHDRSWRMLVPTWLHGVPSLGLTPHRIAVSRPRHSCSEGSAGVLTCQFRNQRGQHGRPRGMLRSRKELGELPGIRRHRRTSTRRTTSRATTLTAAEWSSTAGKLPAPLGYGLWYLSQPA